MDIALGIGILVTAAMVTTAEAAVDPNEERAYKAIAEATYKQTGMEAFVQAYERKNVPEPVREVIGWGMTATKIITEKQITYKWGF